MFFSVFVFDHVTGERRIPISVSHCASLKYMVSNIKCKNMFQQFLRDQKWGIWNGQCGMYSKIPVFKGPKYYILIAES